MTKNAIKVNGCLAWGVGGFLAFALFAILFPVFDKAREPHPETSCASNMNQLGLGLAQYEEDYDNLMPSGSVPGGQGLGWAGQVWSYVKSIGVFTCPDDPARDDPGPASNTDSTQFNYPISYAYNRNIAGIKTKTIHDPAHTIVLFEAQGGKAHFEESDEGRAHGARSFSPIGDGTDGSLAASLSSREALQYVTGVIGNRRTAPTSTTQFQNPIGIHNGGANYLFADSHVQRLKPELVSSGSNALSSHAPQTGAMAGQAAGTLNPKYAATFSAK